MFLLPFIFAGAFMLGALNPWYTATLITQTIPRTRLLGRALSHIVGSLPGHADDAGSLRLYPCPDSARNVSELVEDASFASWDVGYLLISDDKDYIHAPPQNPTISVSSETLELFLLVVLLVLLAYGSKTLQSKFRVPQPLSSASSVLEDIVAQSSPKAYTPRSSPTPDGHGDITEQSPIPAKLEFVAPDDADAAGGSSFILSTRAALDAIMALPTRLYPAPVHVAGDIDELLEEPSVDPAKGTLRLGAGLSIAIADSLDASLCSIEPVSELDCRLADGEDFPVRFDNTPRGRGRTQVPPISNADWSRTGTSAAVRARIATAFVEEVSKDQNAVAGTSETIGRPGVLQRRPRPKNPPVTVWPRIPLETRRQRMPSVQPANNSEWDGPRRSRTISGA